MSISIHLYTKASMVAFVMWLWKLWQETHGPHVFQSFFLFVMPSCQDRWCALGAAALSSLLVVGVRLMKLWKDSCWPWKGGWVERGSWEWRVVICCIVQNVMIGVEAMHDQAGHSQRMSRYTPETHSHPQPLHAHAHAHPGMPQLSPEHLGWNDCWIKVKAMVKVVALVRVTLCQGYEVGK